LDRKADRCQACQKDGFGNLFVLQGHRSGAVKKSNRMNITCISCQKEFSASGEIFEISDNGEEKNICRQCLVNITLCSEYSKNAMLEKPDWKVAKNSKTQHLFRISLSSLCGMTSVKSSNFLENPNGQKKCSRCEKFQQ
jgi:hypothetical protein